MSDEQATPPWIFNLEGTLRGFLGNNPNRPRSLVFEVDREAIAVEIPRELRGRIRYQLQPGDRICCVGRSQIDLDAGVVRLSAYQLFSLPLEVRPQAAVAAAVAP